MTLVSTRHFVRDLACIFKRHIFIGRCHAFLHHKRRQLFPLICRILKYFNLCLRFGKHFLVFPRFFFCCSHFSFSNQYTIGWNITSINDASVIRSAREKFLPTIGQGQLVVHAPKGSTAAKFAEQCALKFEPMYNGQRKQIELVCSNDVMDAIIDKFGKDVTVLANDMQSFRAVVNTAVGHVFYSWVFGFAGKVTIKSPNDVKKSYAIMVKQAAQALIE